MSSRDRAPIWADDPTNELPPALTSMWRLF